MGNETPPWVIQIPKDSHLRKYPIYQWFVVGFDSICQSAYSAKHIPNMEPEDLYVLVCDIVLEGTGFTPQDFVDKIISMEKEIVRLKEEIEKNHES